MIDDELAAMLEKASAHWESLSAVDRALAEDQQRRSWVKAETGRDPGIHPLAKEVLRLRQELANQRAGKLNRDERDRLDCLRRRAYHLENRIDRAPASELFHDKAELSALRWAIQRISGEYVSTPLPAEGT